MFDVYSVCVFFFFRILYKCLFLLEYFILLLQNQTCEQTAINHQMTTQKQQIK